MTIKIEFRGLVNILQDIWLNLKFQKASSHIRCQFLTV